MLEKIGIAVAVAIAVISGVGFYAQHQQCNESGGLFVRGLFGNECIKK